MPEEVDIVQHSFVQAKKKNRFRVPLFPVFAGWKRDKPGIKVLSMLCSTVYFNHGALIHARVHRPIHIDWV